MYEVNLYKTRTIDKNTYSETINQKKNVYWIKNNKLYYVFMENYR